MAAEYLNEYVGAVNIALSLTALARWRAPTPAGRRRLLGPDDLEVLVDEDVVWPVDANCVDVVLAVAQLHNTVDDSPRVGGQRSLRRLVRCCSTDDCPRPLTKARRDLTDLL